MTLRGVGIVLIAALASACAHRRPPYPWVRRLTFHGVRHADARALRSHLVTEETAHVLGAPRRRFDPFALRLDAARIEDYYRAHGWFDARVVSTDVRPAGHGAVEVTIDVDEGVPTRMRRVQVTGLDLVGDDAQSVIRNLDLRKGQIFDATRYVAEKGEMRQRLKTLGYAFADVAGDVVVDRDRHLADVTLRTDPGQKTRIGRVDVEGAYRVDRALLARHSLLRPGQLLTPEALQRARAKLYNLGFLSSVRVDYGHDAADPGAADVRLSVDEGAFDQWRLGLGVSLELQRSELRGRAEYTRYDFLGGLRRLRIRAEPAYVFVPAFWQPDRQGPAASVEAELTQPDLALPPDELRAAAGYDLGVEYAFQYYGPRAQLGYARNFLHDRLQPGISYNFQFLQFFNVDPALAADPATAARVYGFTDPYRVAWLDEAIVLDLRDRPLDPHKGGWFAVRGEEGGLWSGGSFDYEKITIEARGYYPLFGRLVIAARTRFGQIFAQGRNGSPTTRRFYLGGPQSFRGFNFDRLSPQIASGVAGTPALPIGGDQMFLTSLELRVRAVRLFGSWLEVAGFCDAGDVAAPSGQPFDYIDLGELNVAVGGGLRYKTAVGTVRFDVGVRLNRLSAFERDGRPNADPGQPVAFHLSIGEPF
jgi:translocation and assembly module TamA